MVAAAALVSCSPDEEAGSREFEITAQFAHDASAYTQGLLWDDSVLYESTGLYGKSQLRIVDLKTGNIKRSIALPDTRFGEGLALVGARLYQLTWQSGIAYVYDKTTLALVDSIRYPGEGWGLATDGTSLIMSDGSDSLRVMDPSTFKVNRIVHVRHRGSPLLQLNELELYKGRILSNIYGSDWVARIDASSGEVEQLIDFAGLYPKRSRTAQVMNGIAVAPGGNELILTGKQWPMLFQVRLRENGGATKQ